ncbi:MAG: HEPN domain-containing protein [Candidatus Micrarchaeota archaeon]
MTDLNENVRKIPSDRKRALNSLKMAEHKLERAKADLGNNCYEDSLINAYTSMFHSARALLFRDGYKEKNHYGLCMYIREKYHGLLEMRYINELNTLRTIRHKIIYGDEDVNIREVQEAETKSAIELAAGFLNAVKKLIEGNPQKNEQE